MTALQQVPILFIRLAAQRIRATLSGDGKGHIELVGQVADQPGIGNRLHFTLHFDQSQLAASVHELEKVIAEFPVRETTKQ